MSASATDTSKRESAAACFEEAQAATAAGDHPRAVQLLTKAVQLDPKNFIYSTALNEAEKAAKGAGDAEDAGASPNSTASSAADSPPQGAKTPPAEDEVTTRTDSERNLEEKSTPAPPRPRPAADTLPQIMEPLAAPHGAPDFIRNILEATNHYSVLGEEQGAPADVLRRARNALSLATHPDKATDIPGHHEACIRVLEASEVLLDPGKRAAYDREIETAKRVAAMPASEQAAFRGSNGPQYSHFSWFDCKTCSKRGHMCDIVPGRTPEAARFCGDCGSYMPVEEGEMWVEDIGDLFGGLFGGLFGMLFRVRTELRLLICERGRIWDITPVGVCSGLLREWRKYKMPVNTHHNHMHCWNDGKRDCGGYAGPAGEFGAGQGSGWWAEGNWAAGGWGVGGTKGGGGGEGGKQQSKKKNKKKKGRR